MRGTVTLAAALALPARFPHRDLILFSAFLVVLGTLVVQGLTLKPLMARLGIERDDAVQREVRLARLEALRAGATALGDGEAPTEAADLLRRKYRVRLEQAETRARGEAAGDDAFHKVEEELDRAELSAEAMDPED